jgi:hypothetical protein
MKSDFTKYSGEVAAIAGYGFQYSIFATEIYNTLLDNNRQIEWIEFASSEAGKLDDILIGLKDSILAFQVKNIGSSRFSYSTLITSNTQSIVEGMFIGWKKLKSNNSDKKVCVKFITTQQASSNDKIESYSGSTKPSFQDFINNFWTPIFDGTYNRENLPKAWNSTFQELLAKTKSDSSELIGFIKSTEFVFGYSVPKLFNAYVDRQRRIDIENITKQIFQTVVKKGNIRFNKNEFLEYFGLLNRYESYYTHSFFVDEEHYQPIDDTINELEELIKSQSKGYIALVGNAGSGKSTLLTKWLQQSNYKILKYYAYVNMDMNYTSGFRGEAKIFLHDLLVQLRDSKYSTQDRLPTENFEDLQKHFNAELNKLSNAEEKVVILVDGLDHIEREQEVSRSLIGILPVPDNIPKNIYFILGSRTIQNLEKLNPRIKEAVKTENRVITIQPLMKDKIQSLLSSNQIDLPENLLEELFINTKGHPLFLRYTIEAIKSRNFYQLDEIISQRVFSGDIYKEYKVFWDKNKDQDEFIEVLGLIARFRHPFFDIEILNIFSKISRANQFKINKLSEDYFYKVGNIWQFLHSSFKEFLINETAKNIYTDLFDEKIDKQFHLRIFQELNQIKSEYKWNELYHLHKAGEFNTITLLATQDYFRKQWFEFRSYKLVVEDIQIALNACYKQKDIYCLFRCFLSVFELKQRYNNFNPKNYINTFHQLGKISLANSFVYDNVELLVTHKIALSYSIAVYKQGYQQLAKDIFLRATPSYILNRSKRISPERYNRDTFQPIDELELICSWAKAASLFSPVEDVFKRIEGLTIEEGHQDGERDFVAEVATEILEISIEVSNWSNLKSLEAFLSKNNKIRSLFYFYFDVVYNLPDENDFYSHCLEELNSWTIPDDNPINRRLLIVQLLIRKDIGKGSLIFQKLLPPNQIERDKYSIQDEGFINYIFDYSRFLYIITKEFSVSPTNFLPIEEKYTKKAFYQAFAELGRSFCKLPQNSAS